MSKVLTPSVPRVCNLLVHVWEGEPAILGIRWGNCEGPLLRRSKGEALLCWKHLSFEACDLDQQHSTRQSIQKPKICAKMGLLFLHVVHLLRLPGISQLLVSELVRFPQVSATCTATYVVVQRRRNANWKFSPTLNCL